MEHLLAGDAALRAGGTETASTGVDRDTATSTVVAVAVARSTVRPPAVVPKASDLVVGRQPPPEPSEVGSARAAPAHPTAAAAGPPWPPPGPVPRRDPDGPDPADR